MKTSSLLLLIFSLLISNTSKSQTSFLKTYGGNNTEEAYRLAICDDGGYIVAGYTRSSGPGYANMHFIRTDQNGAQLWETIVGGNLVERAYSLAIADDGGFVAAGSTTSFGAGLEDIFVVKVDASGKKIWQRTFGGSGADEAWDIRLTTDGGFIITGFTNSWGADFFDAFLLKIDKNGNEQWKKLYGGGSFDSGFSVRQISDGGFIFLGQTQSMGSGQGDFYLVKTDNNGNKIWDKTFGGTESEEGRYLSFTNDGGFILVGKTESIGAGDEDIYVIKTDADGNFQWEKTYGGDQKDTGKSIEQTSDGGYIIGSSSRSFGLIVPWIYIIKTDGSGEVQWTKTYGGWDNDHCNHVLPTADGGYIATGKINEVASKLEDTYILKMDADGNYDKSASIKKHSLSSGLKIFPNPSDGLVELSINAGNKNSFVLRVFDYSGKIIHSEEFICTSSNCTKQLNLKEFSSGLYLISLSDGESVETSKFSIN